MYLIIIYIVLLLFDSPIYSQLLSAAHNNEGNNIVESLTSKEVTQISAMEGCAQRGTNGTCIQTTTSRTPTPNPSQGIPSAPSLSSKNVSNFLTYENSSYGIRMHYPVDWMYANNNASLSSLQKIVTLMSLKSIKDSPKFPAILTIAVQKIPLNMTLDYYTLLNLRTLTQSQLDGSGPTILAGYPAYEVVFVDKDGKSASEIWMLKGDRAYIIVYTTSVEKYNNYLPAVQNMINSFVTLNTTTIEKQAGL